MAFQAAPKRFFSALSKLFSPVSLAYHDTYLMLALQETVDERGECVEVVLQSESHLQRKLLMFAYGFGTIVMIVILMSTNEVNKAFFIYLVYPSNPTQSWRKLFFTIRKIR
jgi:hypothetical protein